MAEGESNVVDLTKVPDTGDKAVESLECAVCLQTCIHPAQLPCGHIFCFLCIKGIANQSKKCAMCRQEIPRDFIEHPNLLNPPSLVEAVENYDGNYQWFYEGRNGWWKYDDRTSEDIEEAFSMNLRCFEILICGELYVVDFEEKVQYPKYNSSRKRFIKRDKPENVLVKGVAGWWQYDERTSKELETCYKAGERTCELLIAGFLYVTDLEAMLQLRRNDPSRRRRIKRDLATIPKKGIAGLRTESDSHPHQELLHAESHHRPHSPTEGQMDHLTPITPSNTPQSPTSGRESPQQNDLQATMDRIQSLHLENGNSDALQHRERTGSGEESRGHNDGSSYLQVAQRNVFQFRHRNVD